MCAFGGSSRAALYARAVEGHPLDVQQRAEFGFQGLVHVHRSIV